MREGPERYGMREEPESYEMREGPEGYKMCVYNDLDCWVDCRSEMVGFQDCWADFKSFLWLSRDLKVNLFGLQQDT